MIIEEHPTHVLSSDKRRAIYDSPLFLVSEREQYFTLNTQEMKFMRSLDHIEDALYFIISLAYFRKKKTRVDFTYQDSTYDRRYVMQRYFQNKSSPRKLPESENRIKLENKVLKCSGYQRINEKLIKVIEIELNQIARYHPKQSQLFEMLLNLMMVHRIAIPGYRTMQQLISRCWNKEIKRLANLYYRNTSKHQRELVGLLMRKTGHSHQIISIRKDMKNFTTTELRNEIEKHQKLKPIFSAALKVAPKLKLPDSTLEYYASLVNYYRGWRLKKINRDYAQLYLLYYCYMRYQSLNDNLV